MNLDLKYLPHWILVTIYITLLLAGCQSETDRGKERALAPYLTNEARGASFSTPELIEVAFLKDEITDGEQILYLTYAIYEPQLLPAHLNGDQNWSGTSTVQKINIAINDQNRYCSFDSPIQQELRQFYPHIQECQSFRRVVRPGRVASDNPANGHYQYNRTTR